MSIDAKRSRGVFQKLDRDLQKLRSKPEATSVHRFRTGTRRLQILLGDLSPKLGRNEKNLLKQLAKLRKRAGRLRDIDVQLGALRSLKVSREPRRKTQLVNHLIELRREQVDKLRKSADAATIRKARKRLRRAAKDFNLKATRDAIPAAREMLQRLQSDAEPLSEALLHQYRILTKRARYTAEFAGDSQEATQFIAELKKIQDALGDWHDWLTLTQTSILNLGGVRESSLVAELHNITGAKYRNAVAVVSRMNNSSRSPKVSVTSSPVTQAVSAA
jgi:CHAD domain-containing protein